MARDGEILIRKIRGADNPFGFALQLLEADHLDENHNNDLGNGHKIRMGKEYDEWGRCVAYHILKQHPGDTMFATYSYGDKIVVPADQIIHLYLKDRISGSRGQPWLHAAMTSLNMLGGYMEAELTAARIAAAKMGFYEMEDMATMDDMEAETENDDGTGDLIQSVEPGILEKLPPGVRFTGFTPDHPTNAFPDFVKVLLRSIAASIDVSYNYMANDLENVNYSSLRGGKIDENDVWKDLHQFMIDHFFNPVYDDWLKMAILNKKLDLPFSKLAKYKSVFWQPRGFQWVDPVKEVASDKMAVASGFKSEQMVVSGLGYDLETVYRQQKRAKIMREKYGIITENEAKITEMLGKVDDDKN